MSLTNELPRIHPYTYTVCRKELSRPLSGHHRRDATPALEILPRLLKLGFDQGEQLFAQPPLDPRKADPRERLHVNRSGLLPGHLILQTTRPPLDDGRDSPMKQVEPARTDLEDDLFAAWRRVFRHCSRPCVELRAGLASHLEAGFENRATMLFSQRKKGAPYTLLHAPRARRREKPAQSNRTAAFFLRVDQVWSGGPGLAGAFAMDGVATLAWSWHLARGFAHLLAEPGFAVVELEIGDIPPRPTDLRWASTWKATQILRVGAEEIRAGSGSGNDEAAA